MNWARTIAKILILLSILSFGTLATITYKWFLKRESYFQVCQLVAEKFYRYDGDLQDWIEACYEEASATPWQEDVDDLVFRMRSSLARIDSSHLNVYTPLQEPRLWRGEGLDTGIRSIGLNGEVIVLRVLSSSPAEKAGVRRGDKIVSINQKPLATVAEAQFVQGMYVISRQDEELEIEIVPEVLKEEQNIVFSDLENEVAAIQVKSFRSGAFQSLAEIQGLWPLERWERIVLDLRDNSGGNFVSMLRLLSHFVCEKKPIGQLIQPRKVETKTLQLPNEIDEQKQMEFIENFNPIFLSPFKTDSCFDGELVVLINSNTASVSEILADALRTRPRTLLIGQGTAGDVLMAIWYDLPDLGEGFSVSIPEALYVNSKGESLEGRGVWPDEELIYSEKDLLQGLDTWIEVAKKIRMQAL